MNRRVAFPFLTLTDVAVSAANWQLSLNQGEWQDPGEFLADWDPSSSLLIRRTLHIDLAAACTDLALQDDQLALSLEVRIGTGQGRLPRILVQRHVRPLDRETSDIELLFEVPGKALSSVLDLSTDIALARSAESSNPLSPRRRGERVWQDGIRFRLEGEEARFPIEVANIASLAGANGAGAPWYLHWSPRDWSRDFHGAMRLYLNEAKQEFVARVKEEDEQTLQVMMADVMSQICERLLAEPDIADRLTEMEPGSLGAQAQAWLRKAWPGQDIAFIKSVLEGKPGAFRAAFLALAEPTAS